MAPNHRILIVDDNEINLMVVHGHLAKYGLEVVRASSGDAALELLSIEKFDLVMLDCHMPIKDGYAVARELRAKGKREIPIIAHSADWSDENRRRCDEAGMTAFLPKPCNRERLITLVQGYLP